MAYGRAAEDYVAANYFWMSRQVRVPSRTGKAAYRVADLSDGKNILEIKAVGKLKASSQLKDLALEARANGGHFAIIVGRTTVVDAAMVRWMAKYNIGWAR